MGFQRDKALKLRHKMKTEFLFVSKFRLILLDRITFEGCGPYIILFHCLFQKVIN